MSKNPGFMTALIILMAVTRFHYGEGHENWPDASLAVFFLAGYLSSRFANLTGLLGLAVGIDVLAVTVGGVSSYCLTPAYVALLPAYAGVWMAGNFCRFRQWSFFNPALAGFLLLACTGAFLISEAAFYYFSGLIQPDILHYAEGMIRYYPAYVVPSLIYAGSLLLARHVQVSRGYASAPT
jgi:hypothetical protein